MTRSRDIAEILGLTEAENTDNLSLGAGGGGGSGVTSYAYDSAGALLAADSSGYEDGSLHYLSKLREMYVWDDSDGGFFKVDELSADALAGSGGGGFTYQGSVSGYTMAGFASGSIASNVIDKISFSSLANATDVGDLTGSRIDARGIGSSTDGYSVGAYQPGSGRINTIDKFPFSSDGNAALYSGNTLTSIQNSGGMATDGINGYQFGGRTPTASDGINVIQKFNYAVEGNATDVGDLLLAGRYGGGHSSSTHGYSTGNTPGAGITVAPGIDKFSFAADGNATDAGDILYTKKKHISHSSSTHGYLAGGSTNPGVEANSIHKFSFASDGDATDVANLAYDNNSITEVQGLSSTDYGYIAGGSPMPWSSNTIARFAFASDGDATDTTYDLTVGRERIGNTQV